MKLSKRLTIFARTFLLMLAALIVAEGVGVALLLTRPPMHNAPVRLSEIARQLSGDALGPPPPGLGMPGPGGPPPSDRGFGRRREFEMLDSSAAPTAPTGTNLQASEELTGLLAQRLGADRTRVRLYVSDDAAVRGRGPVNEPQLREGFTAAWQRDSGEWRVMRSLVEGFPNAFQRQAMWLFAAGALLMLPVAWLFARALAAPLARFTRGAERLGTDPHAPAIERAGPPEMQSAIDSFNAMQSRITRLLEERSQMIGAIAHDLRTPLMRLSFRLESLDAPLREKVEADINEMRLMISAALDFLRDQAAHRARVPLDLRLLVESVVDDQRDVGQDVNWLTAESVSGSLLIEGDPVALRRLVANVVENSLKYGKCARVRLRTLSGFAVIEVDDDGPGIPESLQQRVFDPFFRAESSRNRETGGIGLGLTTVRAIALDHGGQVELRNRKEGGLRVVVSLPLPGQ